MLVISAAFLALLAHAAAQSMTDTAAAATSTVGSSAATSSIAIPDVCENGTGLYSCLPGDTAITACPEANPVAFTSCACATVTTVMNCYSTYCKAQITSQLMLALSSDSSVFCDGISTDGMASGAAPTNTASTTVMTTAATGAGAKTGGATTASGVAASATSKAGAERGMNHAVPALGGALGLFVGVVGLFL